MTPVGRLLFSVLGRPPNLIRDRDRSRKSARSTNLRAIGALGAAKRPLQLPQESRSRAPGVMGWAEIAIAHRNRAIAKPSIDARRSRRREHRRSHASPNAIAARFARAHESAQRAHPGRAHLALPTAGNRIDALRRHS